MASIPVWFQCASIHITVKELLPVVMSCTLWGHRWKGESVLARSDNAAVVAIINSSRSKDKLVMHLMRCLFFFMARNKHTLVATHVEGKFNVAAVALSRNRLSIFRPTRIPPELQELLVTNGSHPGGKSCGCPFLKRFGIVNPADLQEWKGAVPKVLPGYRLRTSTC